jgi:hypothetical protein
MGRWTKLLTELKFMPEDEPRHVTYGEDETKGAAARFEKALRQGEQNAMAHDIREKGRKAVAALPGIRAKAKAFTEEMRKAHEISEHRAALQRFESWNEKFGAAVKAGTLSSHEASTLEAMSHQRAAALVAQGRRIGAKS